MTLDHAFTGATRESGTIHMSSPPVFSGIRITRSLVLCVCFVDSCLSFCPFSFGHCFVCPSDYPFALFKLFFYERRIC